MATLGTTALTLSDWAKRTDKDGKIDTVVEILSLTNEILMDMAVIEGNLVTGHMTTIRTGIPAPTWRLLNYGVPVTKSRTSQVTDTCGMLEDYVQVDKKLANMGGQTNEFRLSEALPHLEGMNQAIATALIYGNQATNPEQFTGLAPRFNDTTAESGDNIISGGGTGSDNTSIWMICWGPNTIHAMFPRGSKAGIEHQDLGEDTLTDAAGGLYQGYRDHWKWEMGLTVRDWRYAVRIANIDVSDLTYNAATGANLINLMTQALEIPPNLGMGRPVFYCNRTIKSLLRQQIVEKVVNSTLTMDSVAGKHVMTFGGVPVRRTDAILSTEAVVS